VWLVAHRAPHVAAGGADDDGGGRPADDRSPARASTAR
jgi:hypothetical protein